MSKASQPSLKGLFDNIPDKPQPIYARLKQAIAHKVANGYWQAHQRVPSEAEMVKALGVSRMTVNRALRELTAEGVLTRQQGLGTFVAPQKAHSALFEVHNIADEVASRGGTYLAQQILLEQRKATMAEAVQLGVRSDHPIFRSVLLHYENQLPIQLEERVVNAQLAPDYGAQDFTRQPPYVYLMQAAPLTEGEHLVEALLPTEQECELLQIAATEPCLQIKRRTWSGEQIVTTARLLHPGSRFQLFGHFASR